jgi:aromatic-L-amino-acid decarboxylase
VYEVMNAKGEYFLTSTVICGTYVIRVVSATILSEEKYLKGVFEAILDVVEGGKGKAEGNGVAA